MPESEPESSTNEDNIDNILQLSMSESIRQHHSKLSVTENEIETY